MMLRFTIAAVAMLSLAGPAFATRHADVVYLQQFKARQKLLVEAGADAARAKPQAPKQDVAKAPVEAPARAADDAASR